MASTAAKSVAQSRHLQRCLQQVVQTNTFQTHWTSFSATELPLGNEHFRGSVYICVYICGLCDADRRSERRHRPVMRFGPRNLETVETMNVGVDENEREPLPSEVIVKHIASNHHWQNVFPTSSDQKLRPTQFQAPGSQDLLQFRPKERHQQVVICVPVLFIAMEEEHTTSLTNVWFDQNHVDPCASAGFSKYKPQCPLSAKA